MQHRNVGSRSDLGDAPYISGRNYVGLNPFNIGDLAVAQPHGDVGLHDVVGARRTAAQMAFGDIFDDESGSRQ
jgi:hypothetical protein